MTGARDDQAKLIQDDPKLGRLVSAMAEVQNEAAEKRRTAKMRKARRGRVSPLFPVILLVFLPVAYFVGRPPTEELAPVSPDAALRETIYVTALAINSAFEESGEYPAGLEMLGMDEEGLTYARDATGYTLVAESDGASVQYRSGEDLKPFRRAFESLLPPFGGSQ